MGEAALWEEGASRKASCLVYGSLPMMTTRSRFAAAAAEDETSEDLY
jgi:hypothetical protein